MATASAYVLNSATGVILPSTSMAPPITTTSLTLRKVSGSSAAASARLVKGPIATMVIVSCGFSCSSRRISLCAIAWEGMKEVVGEASSAVSSAVAFARGGWNRVFHVSEGDR